MTCLDLVNNRKFSELNKHDCQGYLVKLHLMYHHLASTGNHTLLNELKPILSRYHHNIDVILPYIELDLNAVSQQLLQMDCSQPRNKSELELQKEFENGAPSKRVLMIYEELYHFSKGSKTKLYFGSKTKFFLCRYQSYQDIIRLIVIILFYIPNLPLKPNEIMDVVLSHCKNRLEFTSNIFKNVPLCILQPLTQQLVEYTEKQINIIKKARQSNHQKRMESTGKQIEIMKRIFRNLATLSPLIARYIQNVIASKRICPEIYVELSLSLQENSPKLFIQQFCGNLVNIDEQEYVLRYLGSIHSNHPMVKQLNSYLHKTVEYYHELKSKLTQKQDKDGHPKSEEDDVEMKAEDITKEYTDIVDTLETLITIYVAFVGLVVNIEMDVNAISDLLSLIENDAPYRLLSPLMLFIVLCPRFLKMDRFETVCRVYYDHPILDIDYFMMIHYILQDSYQPVLDSLRNYTTLPLNINVNTFHHFKELKQSFLHLNMSNYIGVFFTSTRSKLLNYDLIQQYVKSMKMINGNQDLDCCRLYLHKLERFLITAQFILHRDLFTPHIMKMDEWLFDVMTAACWATPKIQSGFPNICFTLFKLMDRCAMLTSRMHLEAAMSSTNKMNKEGINAFYNYIELELKTHRGCHSIHCYSNPLQITLCIYFMLLSNHRFYKSYNHYVLNGNGDSFLNDGSDIVMSSNEDPLPATNTFHKASQFYKTPLNTPKHPPFSEEMLYALPVTGCIEYLRLKNINGDNDAKGKESIDKSIEKCIYLIRHHYPHLLYWLDLNSLLVSPKFEFLQYGLNLDLMKDALYFNTSRTKDIKKIHDAFITDFEDNKQEWMDVVSFNVPQCFFSLITNKDIQLLPATLSSDDLSVILSAMAAAFEHNDLAHHKWQYVFCYWWHKYAIHQPLSFVCLSLQAFVKTNISNIRLVLRNPNVLLTVDDDKYPNIWSNVWFMNMYVRIIHVLLTANQVHVVSSQPNIYSTIANESQRNNEKAIDDLNCKQLRSLIILNEINVVETIMKNVEKCRNSSTKTMEIVIELLLWRHCQSLSQGSCYSSSITRSLDNLNLKASYDNKNFKLFRSFVTKYHEKVGFDIISLLLHRTISYSYIPLLINKLVIQHNNNWNVLHEYQPIIIQHFESFSSKLLCPNINNFIEYFESISNGDKAWLFAVIFVLESVTLTDDEVWINCFKYVMEEIRDIIQQWSVIVQNGMICNIKDEQVRTSICNVLNEQWLKIKDTKYMMDGFVIKQLSLSIANNGLRDTEWPYIDVKPTL